MYVRGFRFCFKDKRRTPVENSCSRPQIVGNVETIVPNVANSSATQLTAVDYVGMKLPQLRVLCKQRNLKTSGNEPDFIDRLVSGKNKYLQRNW